MNQRLWSRRATKLFFLKIPAVTENVISVWNLPCFQPPVKFSDLVSLNLRPGNVLLEVDDEVRRILDRSLVATQDFVLVQLVSSGAWI